MLKDLQKKRDEFRSRLKGNINILGLEVHEQDLQKKRDELLERLGGNKNILALETYEQECKKSAKMIQNIDNFRAHAKQGREEIDRSLKQELKEVIAITVLEGENELDYSQIESEVLKMQREQDAFFKIEGNYTEEQQKIFEVKGDISPEEIKKEILRVSQSRLDDSRGAAESIFFKEWKSVEIERESD